MHTKLGVCGCTYKWIVCPPRDCIQVGGTPPLFDCYSKICWRLLSRPPPVRRLDLGERHIPLAFRFYNSASPPRGARTCSATGSTQSGTVCVCVCAFYIEYQATAEWHPRWYRLQGRKICSHEDWLTWGMIFVYHRSIVLVSKSFFFCNSRTTWRRPNLNYHIIQDLKLQGAMPSKLRVFIFCVLCFHVPRCSDWSRGMKMYYSGV